ncbi:hypothetical protein SS50377_23616 [Spironucleus salmonicida]|nr:hypothetical protein SS50377_23616 [Spironucleus salmonicida]
MDQIGTGGHEVLLQFIGVALQALDFIKFRCISELSLKETTRNLYGTEYLSQWEYQGKNGQLDYCAFNVDKLLPIELKAVYHIALDVIGCIRSKNVIKIIQYYINKNLQELKGTLQKQFLNSQESQGVSGILIQPKQSVFPYQCIIIGGLLGSLGSIYSQSIAFYIHIYIEEVERKKQDKEIQMDNTCIQHIVQEVQSLILGVVSIYFENNKTSDIVESKYDLGKQKEGVNQPKQIETKFDITFYDTFHYLISSVLLPLKQLVQFYSDQSSIQTQYFQYSFYIKLNQTFYQNLQQIYNLGNVILTSNDTINRLTGKQLNFFDIFKLLTFNIEEVKAQATNKPSNLQCVLHNLWPSQTLLPDQLVHLFDYDNIIFDFSEIIHVSLLNYKQDDLKIFQQKISEKKHVLVQIECISWISIFRGFILSLQYFQADRNILFYQIAKYQLSYIIRDYDRIERNSYFPSLCFGEYQDSLSMIQEFSDSNVFFQDMYNDNIFSQTPQQQLHMIKDTNLPKTQIINYINSFIDDSIFQTIIQLADHYVCLSFQLIEGLVIVLKLTKYFQSGKSINYLTASKLINVIFKTQTIISKQIYLLKILVELTPEFKIVVTDIISSFMLCKEQGTSIVIKELIQLKDSTTLQKTEEDEFLEMVFNQINEFSKLSSFLSSPQFENDITKPYYFLKEQDKLVISNLRILSNFFVQSVFNGSEFGQYINDCKESPNKQLNIMLTVSWFASYLLGECTSFKPETELLDKIQQLLPQVNSQYSQTSLGLQTFQRFSILKQTLLKLFHQYPSNEIISQFQSIFNSVIDINELQLILQRPLSLDTSNIQDQYQISERLLVQFFLSALKNDIASKSYTISYKFQNLVYQDIQQYNIYFNQPQFSGELGLASPDYLLAAATIMSKPLYDELLIISEAELIFLQQYILSIEGTGNEDSQKKIIVATDILVQCTVLFQQVNLCMDSQILLDGALINVQQYILKTLRILYYIIRQYILMNQSIKIDSNQQTNIHLTKFQMTNFILMQSICILSNQISNLQITQDSWIYLDQNQAQINLFDLLLGLLTQYYQQLQDDFIRQLVLQSIKQFLVLIDTQPSQIKKSYDLQFIFAIHTFSPFSADQLNRIISSGYINNMPLQQYLQQLLSMDQCQLVLQSFISLSMNQINNKNIYQKSQFINNILNPNIFNIEKGLIFVLCFIKQYESQCQELIQNIITFNQRFNISQQILEIFKDLLIIYQFLVQMKSDQVYSQAMLFLDELYYATLQAIYHLFSKVNLVQESFAIKFLDIIFKYITISDMFWLVETQITLEQPFLELSKQQTFEISKILIQLLPILCVSDKNDKFIVNYSLHTLTGQYYTPDSVIRILILVQSLYIANPMRIIEDFNNMLFKHPTQAAIVIFSLSYKNLQEVPIFYQYLFKTKLNFNKHFDKYLFEVGSSNISDDSESSESAEESNTFSKKRLKFGEDNLYRIIKKYINEEQKYPSLEKDVNEYKNNTNSFILSGLKSLFLTNLLCKKDIYSFIAHAIQIILPINPYIPQDKDDYIQVCFQVHCRATADFCGYQFAPQEFLFQQYNLSNVKYQLNIRLAKKYIESMRNAYFFDNNHLVTLQYVQNISGSQFTVQPRTDACKTITFQCLFPQVLRQVFPNMWPEFLLINVDVIFQQINEFITGEQTQTSLNLPPALQSIEIQWYLSKSYKDQEKNWNNQKMQNLNLLVAIIHQLSLSRDDSFTPTNGLVKSVYDIHLFLVQNINIIPQKDKTIVMMRSLDAIQYLLTSPKSIISQLFPQIIPQTAIQLPKAEIGIYCARLSGHLLSQNICVTPQAVLLYAALFMMIGKDLHGFQFILKHQGYFLYSIDKDKLEEIDKKCQVEDGDQIIKEVYYELCKFYQLEVVVGEMLKEKIKEIE